MKMLRDYADGPFGQIHFRYAEAGRPLLLIHQASNSSRQFEAVYPLFAAEGFRPIGLDLPGYGGSEPAPFAPHMEDWIRIVNPVLDHLHVAKTDIVGHHTGAPFATEYTLRHPNRVGKLVLHGALLFTRDARAARLNGIDKTQGGRPASLDGSHLAEAFQARAAMYGPGADPQVITRYITDSYSMTGPSWHGTYAVYSYHHAKALMALHHDMMVITNTGDRVYPETRKIRELRPDIPYVELPGGTVDIQDQQPAEWVAAIAKFLKA